MTERKIHTINHNDTLGITAANLYPERGDSSVRHYNHEMDIIMQTEAQSAVVLPDVPRSKLPYVGGVTCPNRCCSGAICVACGRMGAKAHIQPFKSRWRDEWQKAHGEPGIICDQTNLILSADIPLHIVKETHGMQRQCDYGRPVHTVLEELNYPQNKLLDITLWRHPLHMAESCARLDDWSIGDDPENINLAYRKTLQSMLSAQEKGIPTIPIAAELMTTDDSAEQVVHNMLEVIKDETGLELPYTPKAVDWGKTGGYETDVVHYQIPPDTYIKGTSRKLHEKNGRFGLRYKPRRRDEMIWSIDEQEFVLSQLEESCAIHQEMYHKSKEVLRL